MRRGAMQWNAMEGVGETTRKKQRTFTHIPTQVPQPVEVVEHERQGDDEFEAGLDGGGDTCHIQGSQHTSTN